MQCETFEKLIEAYLEDALDDLQRRAFREHLGSCECCRDKAICVDPSLMLSAMPPRAEDSQKIEAVTQAVMGQIRQQRIDRRIHGRGRQWLAAAAMVVVSLVGVTGWRLLSSDGGEAPMLAVAQVQATEQTVPPPRVEVDMPGEGVRVYQYADEDDSDTAVYFIVNPAMEL